MFASSIFGIRNAFSRVSTTKSVEKTLFKVFASKYTTNFSNKRHKLITSENEALNAIQDGSKILIGGFGLCGIPENLIRLLAEKEVKDLTVVSNNVGSDKHGLEKLLKKKRIKRLITSSGGQSAEFEKRFISGELEVEFTPQGTLAERIRAGGAGIPAFFTPTANGTLVQDGGIPIKYDKDGKVEISSQQRETKQFGEKQYILEEAITGDFALIKAWKGDAAGNLVFRKAARNFNPTMAKAVKTTIAEVEEIVNIGDISPDDVHLPGIYIDGVMLGQKYDKRIEKVTVQKGADDRDSVLKRSPAAEAVDKIIARVVLEFQNGMYINLGSGLPIMAANEIPEDIQVFIQSEIGILGVGPWPKSKEVDPDLVNGARETTTAVAGASFFSSNEGFDMLRGGHVDLTVVGASEVSQYGDISGWMVPGKPIKGIGAAMDLVSAPDTRLIACMEHVGKDGSKRIVESCALPLTGQKCVDMIITEKAVFNVDPEAGLTLIEIMEGATLEDIVMSTGCSFQISEELTAAREAQ